VSHAVEVLGQDDHYQGFYSLSSFRLRHTLFQGGWSEPLKRELLHRGSCVAVLPYDPVRDEVLLIEQFRIGALNRKDPPWLTEIVAGGVESGESPEAVAHREGMEEAGVRFSHLHRIGEFFTSPGGTSEKVTLFVGEVEEPLAAGHHGLSDEHEDIRAWVVPFGEALEGVASGEVDSVIPALALLWLSSHRERIRASRPA
jgi:ADP-ribose pyrophosphatase